MEPRHTVCLSVDRARPDAALIADAAQLLRAGKLVVFPTETVYGLGAHALDAGAVAGVFAAKGRPSTDPLIVHVAHAGALASLAREIPESARALAARFWPGPLTLIVPKRTEVPDIVTAGLDSVAVRVPAHPVALALLTAARVPVAAPSANRFSRPSPTTAAHVLIDLEGRVDLVLDAGPTDIGVESTIVDCTVSPPVIRRAGGAPFDVLAEVVPELRVAQTVADVAAAQVAPGQLLRHYAPNARLTAYIGAPAAVVVRLGGEIRRHVGQGARVGVLAPDDDLLALAPEIAASAAHGRVVTANLGKRSDPTAAARALFAALRALDASDVDVIVASGPVVTGLGAAVWDRLSRAAEGRVVPV
jgi:L-threonylcarbamoyladenylate synthase